jgi:multiple sugar transport system ATP-binding protein
MNFFSRHDQPDGGRMRIKGNSAFPYACAVKEPRTYAGKALSSALTRDIHDVHLVPPNIAAAKVSAKVDVTELMGNEILLYLLTGKNTFVARVDPRSQLRVGNQAEVALNVEKLHVFDAATEQAL